MDSAIAAILFSFDFSIHDSMKAQWIEKNILRCILPQTRVLINAHTLYHLAGSALLVRLTRKIASFMLVQERVLDVSSLLSSVDVSRITNPSPSHPTIPRNEEGGTRSMCMHLHVYVLAIKMGRRRWSRLSRLSFPRSVWKALESNDTLRKWHGILTEW